MAEKLRKPALFKHGRVWIRADFHLHTNADKEFTVTGDESYYFSNYLDGLNKAEIRVGLIANHNKFDVDEFKALRKTAKKQEIFLIPGVELFVNDGAHGIHTLVAFSDQWLENGQDYISPFITAMFPGKTVEQYANGNFRSNKNILQVVAELDKVSRDYFLIFAHVEELKGLWKEMQGGKLGDWKDDRYKTVCEKTLGFQKVRTRDLKAKIQLCLGSWYPAEVEGSDPKAVDQIGQGRASYLKIGDFTFEAVKYALPDHPNLVAMQPIKHERSHIVSATFEGGVLGSTGL